MVARVAARPPYTAIRARSEIRRKPCTRAAWPSLTTRNSTASESRATGRVRSLVPNESREIGPESTSNRTAPSAPRATDVRRSTAAVRATRAVSPDPTAAAICLTPLLFTPMPAMLWARLLIDR